MTDTFAEERAELDREEWQNAMDQLETDPEADE